MGAPGCCSSLLILGVLVSATAAALDFAAQPSAAEVQALQGSEWMRRSLEIMRRMEEAAEAPAEAAGRPDPWRRQSEQEAISEESIARARAIVEGTPLPRAGAQRPSSPFRGAHPVSEEGRPPADSIAIFASFAMPLPELLAALDEAKAVGGVVVFRGVGDGETIDGFFGRLHALAARHRPEWKAAGVAPLVTINPPLFLRHGITAVPAVLVQENGRDAIASGVLSTEQVRERRARAADAGEAAVNLGRFGPTYAIAEPDLIEVMKRRLLAFDWEGAKERSLDAFWSKRKPVPLSQARMTAVRYFDPSVRVTRDIDAAGSLVARAGTVVNPMDAVPFRKTLLVFDPTDDREVAAIAREIADYRNGGGAVGNLVFLVSSVDGQGKPGRQGWEAWARLQARLARLAGAPVRVYLLDEAVAKRYGIVATPTVIAPEERRFRVKEIGIAPAAKGASS